MKFEGNIKASIYQPLCLSDLPPVHKMTEDLWYHALKFLDKYRWHTITWSISKSNWMIQKWNQLIWYEYLISLISTNKSYSYSKQNISFGGFSQNEHLFYFFCCIILYFMTAFSLLSSLYCLVSFIRSWRSSTYKETPTRDILIQTQLLPLTSHQNSTNLPFSAQF